MYETDFLPRRLTEHIKKPKGIILNFHCTTIFKEAQKTLVNVSVYEVKKTKK